jgi:hypothetical protein
MSQVTMSEVTLEEKSNSMKIPMEHQFLHLITGLAAKM